MWLRALRSMHFILSLSPVGDGPGRGQHHVGPLVAAVCVDVTDTSLMAIIAPSHFTQLLPQPQISREWLFIRQLTVFYNVVTDACVELWGPSRCTSGRLVLLLLKGHSCGCCSSSSLVSVRVCSQGFFHRILGCSTAGMEFRAARKVRHWLCLYPALCSQLPRHLSTWDSPSSLVIPNSPL